MKTIFNINQKKQVAEIRYMNKSAAPRQKMNAPAAIAGMLFVSLLLAGCSGPGFNVLPTQADSPVGASVSVVAAENFYGDLARQLGAGHVAVTSILSDPNVDPHAYESSVQNGVAVSQAQLVIQNGAGYDTWIDKLLSASPNPERVVLVAYDLAGVKLTDNPHVWYSADNMDAIAQRITAVLEKLDSPHAADYRTALADFRKSLTPIRQKIAEIKAKYQGAPIGLTETIFLYQTGPAGLQVLTPFEFEKAIAEGNDPPAAAVISADDQITKRKIKVLIYNAQTVTPLTNNLQSEASQNGIPSVAVTETMPAGMTYQTWMLAQLNDLERALGG